jgi:hypothetical protein
MWEKQNVADEPGFLDALFLFISSNGWPKGHIRALLSAYLRFFDPLRHSFIQVANFLKFLALAKATVFGEKWLKIDSRYHIFDASTGPTAIARHVLTSEDALVAFEDCGIDGVVSNSSIAQYAFAAAMTMASDGLRQPAISTDAIHQTKVLFEWNSDGSGMRFPNLATQFANSVLSPLYDRTVPDGFAQSIVTFFKERLGDPRSRRERWSGVSEEALNVMLRLLIRSTLEDFFSVISATAERRHWDARRRFWLAYQEQGEIAEAWVAFGPSATNRARGFDSEYGTLMNATQPTHSAVFMRIRNVIICEWSHNGRCRFYPKRSSMWFPTLYQKNYDFRDLHSNCMDPTFYRPHMEGWERRFASVVYQLTGVYHPIYGRGSSE